MLFHKALVFLPFVLWVAGCSFKEFTPVGPQTRPLREFDRIEVRPFTTNLVQGVPQAEELSKRLPAFASSFSAELRSRLYRKNLLNAAKGRLLVLEGSVTKFETAGEAPITRSSSNTITGTVEIEVVFKDETGERVGGGKVSATAHQDTPAFALELAEKRTVVAVAEHLRRSIRGGSEPPAEEAPEKP